MSYSRRQLYAMGETFGDSATRMEAGGRIVYGGGGGGGDQPKTVEPTTRVTEYGPDMASFNRSSTNEIPRYLTDASQDLVARGQALSSRPYEAYTGARVAEFSPLMNQAFDRMGGQQVAGQIGQATGLAGLAGQRAMQAGSSLGPYDPYQTQAPAQYAAGQYNPYTEQATAQYAAGQYNPYTEQATAQYAAGQYNPYEMGGFDAQRAQQYMNPYMQNVVDVERRKAQEASDRQSAQLSGQAAKTGAFGGSGAALQQRALRRDTAQQLGDIQTQGMGRAYDQGLARFGAEEAMREQSRQYGSGLGESSRQFGAQFGEASLQAERARQEASRQFGANYGESSRQFGAQFGEAALRAEREMAERSRQFGANFGESSRQFGAQFGESSLQAERARQEASRQFGANYGLQGEQLGLEGLRTGLSASGQLGQLGQQQFGQEMDITKGIATAGDVQRQREQALLDVGYGDYLTAQKYPYEQLAFQQGLVAGVPYSTTQRSAGQEISQRGKTVEQTMKTTEKAPNNQVDAITPMPTPMNRSNMAAGGVVGHYDEGGITSLLSNEQINRRQQNPNISDLARMAVQAEKLKRDQIYQDAVAQEAMMAQRQPTVAAIERDRIAAIEGGIGGLDVPDDLVGDEYTAAGGGIVAFSNLGEVPAMTDEFGAPQAVPASSRFTPTDASDNRFARGPAPDMSGTRGRQGIAQLITPPADTGGGPARSSTSFLDKMFGDQEKLLREANTKEADARRAYMEDMEKDKTESSEFAAKARQKIEQRMAGLEGEDRAALESSVLDFGLRLLSAKGEKNMAKAFASAGLNTLAGHKQAMKDIAAKRDKYDDALTKVDELERGERKGTAKERRAAMLSLGQIDADLSKSMANLAGERGTIAFQMWKEGRADARAQSSRSPDELALLTKYPAGTKEGDTLRENIEFKKGAGKADPVLQNPVFKEKARLLGMLETRYSMIQDKEVKSQLESQINNLKIEMAGMYRGGGGSAGKSGSGTLNAADQALLDKYR